MRWWVPCLTCVCLSTRIQYLFIPEGNKSHAMYWCTEYWIPELVRRGVSVPPIFPLSAARLSTP